MDGVTLPPVYWRARAGLDALVDTLGEARFVGGSVRDALLDTPAADIDLATPLPPQAVIDRLKAAGIRAVPTGI